MHRFGRIFGARLVDLPGAENLEEKEGGVGSRTRLFSASQSFSGESCSINEASVSQ